MGREDFGIGADGLRREALRSGRSGSFSRDGSAQEEDAKMLRGTTPESFPQAGNVQSTLTEKIHSARIAASSGPCASWAEI